MADADPDTWSLPSEARPAPLDTLDAEGARAASPAESVRRLYSKLDEELLRGVALSECLRNCGQHWQRPLAESMHDIEKQSYGKSFKVARYHHFLSHDWETSGTKKVSSVLLLTNSLAACLATMFCSVLLGLVRDTRRPEGLRPQRHVSSFLPYVAYLFFLLFWQTLRTAARRPVVVFHDRLCIAQHDRALKQKGILGLSAFLDRSEHMIILWSHRYFTRMWCCYELATYLRHPEAVRPLTLFAVDMSVVIFLLKVVGVLLIVQAQMRNLLLGDDLQLRVLFGTQAIIGFSFFSSVAVYWTVGVSKDLTDLEPQLSEFRVQFAESFCCTSQHVGPSGQVLACDRQLIFEAIRDWYGAGETEEQLEDFNRTVRATLKRRALEGAQTATVPLSIMLYSALCTVAPLVCDGVTHIKAIWHWRSDVGPWLALWRSLAVLSWLASYAYTGVLWYHVFVKVCQVLYPYLEKMTRWKQTLLPWCANTGLGLMMLGIFVWAYEVLDQAGHGDFWPLLAAILLLPGVYIFSLRSCRCSQCFTNIFQFKGFKRVAIK